MKKPPFLPGFGFADNLEVSKKRQKSSLNLSGALAWSDGLILEKPISPQRFEEKITQEISPWRLLPLYLIAASVFIVVFARLVSLQLIEGSLFLSQAQENGYQIKVVHAPRGVIYDRNGEVLARNRPAFRVAWDISLTPKEKVDGVKKTLATLLKISESDIDEKLKSLAPVKREFGPPEVVTIKANVDRDTILQLETKEAQLPGIISEISPVREYPYGEYVAHLLGYTGEVSAQELQQPEYANYRGGDIVGKDGLEKEHETKLRGQAGQELVKVDSLGKKIGTLFSSGSVSGGNLTLSLDVKLQIKAYEALKKAVEEKKAPGGSVVISDPETGEILSLVSYPSFNNNLFAQGISTKDYGQLLKDTRTPLLNRVVSAAYPPGSIFKIITSAAALESGKVTSATLIEDTGSVSLGPITFNNWYFTQYGRKEGEVDLVKALQRSNDTYYYRVGQIIGEKPIQDYALKYGFGQVLGLDLPGETTGLVPTDDWKRRVLGEPWYPGNTLNLAIGQGDLLATPLQVNTMTQVVANGGKLLRPHLLKDNTIQILRDHVTSESYLQVIEEGMKRVVRIGGTAWPLFGFPVSLAGKTGTAESGDKEPHAWFSVYGPTDRPQINVTVMIEKSGEGSSVAAPVAKEILNWWFFEKKGEKVPQATISGEKIGD